MLAAELTGRNPGFSLAKDTDDLFVGKTLLHGDVLTWLMKTLLTSRCVNQRGAGHCISIAKELKQWKAENSARSDELTAKIRDKGVDSLTKAEQLEWKNLRSSQSNFDGSINTLLYRAKMFGGSKETPTEIVNIFGHSAIANAAGIAGGAAKANSRGSQGSAIPVPIPTKASNGMIYQSNGKHTPGQMVIIEMPALSQ